MRERICEKEGRKRDDDEDDDDDGDDNVVVLITKPTFTVFRPNGDSGQAIARGELRERQEYS